MCAALWNARAYWHRPVSGDELYAPHAYEEVAELVEPGVAARLDREAVYGLWVWNTRKTTRRKVWDEAADEFKIRYNYAPRPKEEWLFVPVPDAGIPKKVVEDARQSLKDNARKPSEAAQRFWELSVAASCAVANAGTPYGLTQSTKIVPAIKHTTILAVLAITPARAAIARTGSTCELRE